MAEDLSTGMGDFQKQLRRYQHMAVNLSRTMHKLLNDVELIVGKYCYMLV
jgi:hypothetical protein